MSKLYPGYSQNHDVAPKTRKDREKMVADSNLRIALTFGVELLVIGALIWFALIAL
jgi:hypothetical protein